jgi:hypothetical protein
MHQYPYFASFESFQHEARQILDSDQSLQALQITDPQLKQLCEYYLNNLRSTGNRYDSATFLARLRWVAKHQSLLSMGGISNFRELNDILEDLSHPYWRYKAGEELLENIGDSYVGPLAIFGLTLRDMLKFSEENKIVALTILLKDSNLTAQFGQEVASKSVLKDVTFEDFSSFI